VCRTVLFVNLQDFIGCFRGREVVRLFKLLLSPYRLTGSFKMCRTVLHRSPEDLRGRLVLSNALSGELLNTDFGNPCRA
jgi:hypothetical protein